jgi:hypothetical protein
MEGQPSFQKPIDGLRFFLLICAGIAHAHESGVYHLDIKPTNIFLRNGIPVVGDLGICFIEDGEYVMTSEGPRGVERTQHSTGKPAANRTAIDLARYL